MLVAREEQVMPGEVRAISRALQEFNSSAYPFVQVIRQAMGHQGCKRPVLSGRRTSHFSMALLVLWLLVVTGCRKHDFPQYSSDYREYAYVTNGGSGTVSVIDVVNVRLDRELAVGKNPVAVAANPARNEVYVVNSGAENQPGSLSVINAEGNTVAATIALHRRPVAIAVDAAGEWAYVANSGSNTVSVIDLKNRREATQIGTGEEPDFARLTPDGKTLIIANRQGASASIVDLSNPASSAYRKVRAVFEGCPGASDVVVLPDSSKAFVACSAGHQIMAISLARSAKGDGQSESAQPDRMEALLDVGRAPVQLALKPDGGELFTLNSLSNSISEVVTSTDDVGGAYLMGANPVRGLVSSDNSLLYVGNLSSEEVTIYSIDDGKRKGSIHVGDGPSALAFSAAGHLLFVVDAHSADVAAVRTSTSSLFTLIPVGRDPNAIVLKAFKTH
jgi:YVTN family beta-propeller protein